MTLTKHFSVLVAVASICCTVYAQETEISRRDVPPAVLAAVEKAYPNAKVLEWEKEIHSGKLYYEAEAVDGKVPRNILYSPDGGVAQITEKVGISDIPAPVVEGVKRQYPKASIRSAQKVTNGEVVEYALSLNGANQKRVVIRADGTIASSEGKTAVDRNQ